MSLFEGVFLRPPGRRAGVWQFEVDERFNGGGAAAISP